MRALTTFSAAIAAVLLFSTTGFAQPAVAGIVRDSSGAILPGVSVEASSPVLIEKSRTVVTDGTGQYRIVDLIPGTYSVTFALSGFATIRRAGIELTGAGVTTINADMRVGAVTETVTVTGETPVVDTQTSTKREVVLSNAVLAAVTALLVTPTYLAKFDMGDVIGLKAFYAAIIGGFNQTRGALLGGVLVGVLENLTGAYLSPAYKEGVALMLFLVVILFKPEGLLGKAEERKV